MTRRSNKNKTNETTPSPAVPETFPQAGIWPVEFCRPLWAALMAAIVVLLGGILFWLASMNRLVWFKITVAWFLGLAQPASVYPSSLDTALVLWAGAVVVCSGLVHPSVGLVALAMFRHWIDGYTFPSDNLYFTAGILYLTALWALRMLAGTDRPRLWRPSFLLTLFFLASAAVIPASVQLDRTYRELLHWATYLVLFFLTTNAIRSRRTFYLLLIGLSVSMAVQTVYSILHYYYLLPTLRDMLMQSPEMRLKYFGVDDFTPELIRRFNINRAFGTLLFPNGLAAFLILGLPFSMAGAALGWRSLHGIWIPSKEEARKEAASSRRYRAMALATVAWFIGVVVFFAMAVFVIANIDPAATFETIMYGLGGGAMLAALVPAVFVFLVAGSRGTLATGYAIQAAGLSLLAFLQGWALLLTYSRGGMLAFLASLIVGVFLLMRPSWLFRFGLSKGLAAGLAIFLTLSAFVAVLSSNSWAEAQETTGVVESVPPPPADPASDALKTEGVSIGIREMTDPASFRIRLTYWRVALTMFRHHWLTGVGLGNFGMAYPQYQYLGAGDVRLAHNSFLQFFCEAGLVGGLLFLGFWAYFFLSGALIILRTTGFWERLLRASLYTGVLAFCLHAFIDINFSHPSLVFYVMVYAGLFLVHARLPQDMTEASPPEKSGAITQLLALPLLIALALTLGFACRIYSHDLALSRVSMMNVANSEPMQMRLSLGRTLLETYKTALDPSLPKLRIYVTNVQMFVDDPQQLSEMGALYEPMPNTPRGARRLEPGDPIPDDAILMVTRPWRVFNYTREGIDRILAELESIDRRYPYSEDLAIHFTEWYQLLLDVLLNESHNDLRRQYWERRTFWAREVARRSPALADAHLFCGHQLWVRAAHPDATNPEPLLLEALDHFRKAVQLGPNLPKNCYMLSSASQALGNLYKSVGRDEEAAQRIREAETMKKQGDDLQLRRYALGLF